MHLASHASRLTPHALRLTLYALRPWARQTRYVKCGDQTPFDT